MNLAISMLPLARRRDPHTSHAAASEAKELAMRHQRLILHVLKEYGPLGKDGIASLSRLDGVQVCRRLSELHKAGLIELTGCVVPSNTGRFERQWRAV
jgi:predicted ArsR family transcriptional regulator